MNDTSRTIIVILSIILLIGLFVFLSNKEVESYKSPNNDIEEKDNNKEENKEQENKEQEEKEEKFKFREINDTVDKAMYMMSIFYTYSSVAEYVVNLNENEDYQELKFNLNDLREYLYTLFDKDLVENKIKESLEYEFKEINNKLYVNRGFVPQYSYYDGYNGKYETINENGLIKFKINLVIEDDLSPCNKEHTYIMEKQNGEYKFKEFSLPPCVCYN